MGSTIIRTCILSVLLSGVAHAQSVFDQFGQDAGDCIPIAAIEKVATVKPLNNDQFQFVRAAYTFIPPITPRMPVGDSAIVAESGDERLIALVTEGPQGKETCARFVAAGFIWKMIEQVGSGYVEKLGDPT